MMRYIIIGSCIAACGAIEGIRSIDKNGEITVIDGEGRGAYTRPLISYFLTDSDQPMQYRCKDFFRDNNIELISGWAEDINVQAHTVQIKDGFRLKYDRLLIATGAYPFIPPITGIDQPWVKTFYTLTDAEYINSHIQRGDHNLIIGSGLIGLKAAEALLQRGLAVTVTEREEHILPRQLTAASAAFLHQHLIDAGMKIITGTEVVSIMDDHQVKLRDGSVIHANMVILAAGTRPAAGIASKCGLEIKQGIVVDQEMKTSHPDIYAAGDVAETRNALTGKTELIALLPHAHREGYLAGCSMAGQSCENQGEIPFNSVKLCNCHINSAGTIGNNGSILNWRQGKKLLELYFKDRYLSAYIAVNMPEICGPLTNSITKRIQVPEEQWLEFIKNGPSLSTIPQAYWEAIRGGEQYERFECSPL